MASRNMAATSTSTCRATKSASRSTRRAPSSRDCGSARSCCSWEKSSAAPEATVAGEGLLHNVPIRRKLTLAILATCASVLFLACLTLAIFEVFDFRQRLVRDMTVMADVLDRNTQAAVAFSDEDS